MGEVDIRDLSLIFPLDSGRAEGSALIGIDGVIGLSRQKIES